MTFSMRPFLLISLATMLCNIAVADDFFGSIETRSSGPSASDSEWRHRAWVQQKTGYGYRQPAAEFARDEAALTRSETQVYGQLDWRREAWHLRMAGSVIQDWLPDAERAGLWSGYTFNQEQQDARRWRWEGSDSYLSWQSGDWWLKGGYQTLAWGEAESLKITDVLARRDQRWPGQEDLEALRLPVPAFLVSWRNQLDLVLLAETSPDKLPAGYEEFDPYIGLRTTNPGVRIEQQRGDGAGAALRWQQRWPGLDMQLILANVYSYEVAPSSFSLTDTPEPSLTQLTLAPWRQQIAGIALQATRGTWLFKTEQAWHRGVRLQPEAPLETWPEQDLWRGMLAAEYSGINNLTLSGEVSWQLIPDRHPALANEQRETGLGLRARYTLFNERLTLGGLALRLPGNQGDLLRLNADWDASDRLTIGLSLVDYSAGRDEQLLYPYRHNDTLLFTLRWGL